MKKKRKITKKQNNFWTTHITAFCCLLLLLLPFALREISPSRNNSPKKTNATVKAATDESLVQLYAKMPQAEYCLTVPVIMYHHIQPLYLSDRFDQEGLTVGVEYFDMHMNYLASQGYHTVSADQLVKALITGTSLPPKSIVVTFDDGYEDNFLYALPILHKYHITANFMISTGLTGKHVDNNKYITWDQLRELTKDPLIHLYSHTVNHVDVGNSSKQIDEKEIRGAKQALEQKLGITAPIFTYPYGSTSPLAEQVLKANGYIAAFTTQLGSLQCRSQLLELHRDHVGNLPLSSYGF